MARAAVVVGAGIGGLSAAAGLHRAGWRVTVLERGPSVNPLGTCIALAPNALRALDDIGLGARFREFGLRGGRGGIRLPGGRWLTRVSPAAISERFGEPLVVTQRGRLAGVLLDALPADTVRTATTVTAVDPAGTVHSDAGELAADVVVGADGLWSATRRSLLPAHPPPQRRGTAAWRFVVDAPGLGYPGSETWGRGRYVGLVPLAAEQMYCFAGAPAGRAAGEPRARLRELFGGWHRPIPELIDAAGEVLCHELHALDVPPTFHSGRCALLGDAAHAMLPNLGQGGCQAIEDAVTLASLLRDPDAPVGPALARYTALRRPRARALVRRSAAAHAVAQTTNPLAVAARDAAVAATSLVPDSVLVRGLAPVVSWQPPTP